MKKADHKSRRWQVSRTNNQRKRERIGRIRNLPITLWNGSEIEYGIADRAPKYPPSTLSFSTNQNETSLFLQRLRRRLLIASRKGGGWTKPEKSKRKKPPRIGSFYDFSKIDHIDTNVALVIAAEYQRASEIVGSVPPIINLEAWSSDVFTKLFQIGFFDIIGLSNDSLPLLQNTNDNTIYLRIFTGTRDNTEEADDALMDLARFACPEVELPPTISIPIVSAISEAMINVRRHAYPDDFKFLHRHVSRWWITGKADRLTRTITLAIYDQGATIPVTYQRLEWTDQVVEFVGRAPKDAHPFHLDGKLIRAATRYGNTQTGQRERGKGLPQMKDAVKVAEAGELRVLSRGGEYIYRQSEEEEVFDHRASIGGTLIEWTISLGEVG